MNKKYVFTLILVGLNLFFTCQSCRAERLCYKTGDTAVEQVLYRDKHSLWVRRPSGDVAISLESIEKIKNDDGSISKYDYGTILNTIEENVRKAKYDEAADLCDLLLQSFSKSNEVHYLRAILNHKAGRLSKSMEDYKFIIDNQGGDAKVFNNIGVIYASGKDNERAVEMFNKAVEKNAEIPEIHYNLAFLFLQAKDYNGAISEYNKVITKEPDSIDALYNLSVAYAKNGDYPAAKDRLQKILAIDSNDESAKQALDALSGKK